MFELLHSVRWSLFISQTIIEEFLTFTPPVISPLPKDHQSWKLLFIGVKVPDEISCVSAGVEMKQSESLSQFIKNTKLMNQEFYEGIFQLDKFK